MGDCAHPEVRDSRCVRCGACLHEVVLNGACYFCGAVDIEVTIKPEDQVIAPDRLLRRRGS